ncbi:MAG: choice-of-anchor V domain-containing protein [Promethearchaeota archaeon]
MPFSFSHRIWNILFRKQRNLYVILSMILILFLLGSSSGNSPSDGTNKSCSCHSETGGEITIELQGLPDEYTASTPYDLMVTVTDSVLTTGTGGVWINVDKGTLSTNDPSLHLMDSDLVHLNNLATSWNFTWTSPASGSGWTTITIYGMVSDGGSATGDSWDSTIFQVNEIGGDTSPPPPPETPNFESNIFFGAFLATILFFGFLVVVFLIDYRRRK